GRPFGAIAIGDLADFCDWPGADDVDLVLRRPRCALGHGDGVPEWRGRKLRGVYLHRHVFEIVIFALEVDLRLRQRLLDDVVSLDIHRRRLLRVDAEILQFVPGCAAADTDVEPAIAEMVEHADFLGEPQRMMGGQYVNQRTETETLGA